MKMSLLIINLKLVYDSEPNALLSDFSNGYIWKYHGFLECDVLSSNNKNCIPFIILVQLLKMISRLRLSMVKELYGIFDLELLNITKYLNTKDKTYSIKLNNIGDIIVNKIIILHKEIYKKENDYTLKLINNDMTLFLISSKGEYK